MAEVTARHNPAESGSQFPPPSGWLPNETGYRYTLDAFRPKLDSKGDQTMGAHRSGERRTQRMKRSKRNLVTRLAANTPKKKGKKSGRSA
jgi:hypothetical protein